MTEPTEVSDVPNEPSSEGSYRRLSNIVRALPETELSSLIKRLSIRIDPQKRIDVPNQVARVLVGTPDVRDPSRLPVACQELLHRVAEAQGLLIVPSLPTGFEPLMAKGILFARRSAQGIELVLPYAYLVQLPSWPTEDPRSLRALVAQAPFETASAIAAHYLSRPATPPIALALEPAWEILTEPSRLKQEIERLPLVEQRLLESIEGMGGEVETTELLDLEREPMRLRSAKGVSTTRRGASFALERRALLIPVHPNRHVVPTEVATIVGAERKRDLETRRASIRRDVLGEDHLPRRAQFARDPAALALALVACAREAQNTAPARSMTPATTRTSTSAADIKPNVGTPRSLVLRLAQRVGRSPISVAMVAALSRAIGLWEPLASTPTTPPGSLTIAELGAQLFRAWLNGGAWDEARTEPELLRAPPDQRDPSPIRALREIVLDGLVELGVDGWVPYAPFERYVVEDPRLVGIERLLRRWGERVSSAEGVALAEIVRRIVLESLPVLGVVDLGSESEVAIPTVSVPDDATRASGAYAATMPGRSTTVRLTPRGRALLGRGPASASGTQEKSRFVDTHVLRVGFSALVGHVLTLSVMAEVGRVEESIDLVLSPATIARAISSGAMSDEIRDRIEAIAPLPESLSQLLVQASVVVGKGSLVGCAGFLWVEDQEVREMLRTRRTTMDLFLDPSPQGGLLVAPGVDVERLVRRCRGLGVELEVSGEGILRAGAARSLTPNPGSVIEAPTRGARTSPNKPTPPPIRSRSPLPQPIVEAQASPPVRPRSRG